MSYVFSASWTLWGLVAYIVIGCIGYFVAVFGALLVEDDGIGEPISDRALRWFGIFGIIVAFVLINIVGFAIGGAGSDTPAGAANAASGLGLNSGQSYPIQIGRSVDGSVGQAYAYGGLFSSHTSVSLQPGSSISMNFQSGSSSYILQIPVSKVTFRQSSSSSHVTLYLDNKRQTDSGGYYHDYGSYSESCKPIIKSVVLSSTCTGTLHLKDETKRNGLAPIVANHLESATIALSPGLYQKVLGTP